MQARRSGVLSKPMVKKACASYRVKRTRMAAMTRFATGRVQTLRALSGKKMVTKRSTAVTASVLVEMCVNLGNREFRHGASQKRAGCVNIWGLQTGRLRKECTVSWVTEARGPRGCVVLDGVGWVLRYPWPPSGMGAHLMS